MSAKSQLSPLTKSVAVFRNHIAAVKRLSVIKLIWLFAAVVLPIFSTGAAPVTGVTVLPPKEVLILYSYGQNYQPWVTWSSEIRREMNRMSPWPLNFQEHHLVTAISGDDLADAELIEYLAALYAHQRPDLIVALGAPAARFVQQQRSNLLPTTPMLLAAVNVRRVTQALLSREDAVVGTDVNNVVVFENILQLLPETKTIAMIIGNSPPEKFWVDEIQRELKPLVENKVELLFFNEQPFEDTLKEMARLPPDSAIFFQQMMVDGAGAVYGDKEPLKRIFEVANAPIFTFDQAFFSGEAVGGPMTSPAEGARQTASVAIRMLGGEKASDIQVPPIGFATPTYDWRQLERWNISESRLPPGSDILFRELSVWQKYYWQVVLIAAVISLQAVVILVLLRERHGRQLAEVQSRQRMAELAHVNRFAAAGEMGALVAHEINQPLGAILSNAEAAQIILDSPAPDVSELKEIVSEILHNDGRATEVIKRMRALLKKAPFELRTLDLNDLVQETVDFLAMLARGREVDFASAVVPKMLPVRGDRVQLQQVILNLVMNAIDAMKDLPRANRIITIGTSREGRFAQLSISDEGPGIPDEKLKRIFEPFFTTKAEGMGMGLSIARTIVEAHDGEMSVQNRERGGASFLVKLPLTGGDR